MTVHSFIVQRQNLRETRFVDEAQPLLADGSVRCRIDSFALTSNNVTYGAFGDAMHYWDFFPCSVDGFGRIPVWGFADVIESRAAGVEPGERFYGYWPMSSEAVLQPVEVGEHGFSDGAPHRAERHAVYNQYLRCSRDPGYQAEHEAEIALLRPLFMTSFLIDDFLADNGFFGARSVVLSSASSKTAYGTAFCLARRHDSAVKVIGLTSPGNVDFTEGLGCYDEVLSYEQLTSLPASVPTVYVDMSGSAPLRAALHGHFGDTLAYSCSVGGTHWDELGGGKGLPGPRPVLFFAPAQIKKRRTDWGADGLQQRIGEAWTAFTQRAANPDSPWLRVVHGRGPDAVQRVYASLLAGTMPAQEGHMLSL